MVGADTADAVREDYHFNLPERAVPGSTEVAPLVATDNEAVVIEAVKLADDQSGDVVLRLYEAYGGRAQALLTTGFPLESVVVTDLLRRASEGYENTDAVRSGARHVRLTLRPFQVLILRLTPQAGHSPGRRHEGIPTPGQAAGRV
ncbi:glycosyl hydrolase-related protein [Streptomyces sp. NPDC001020]